MALYLLVLGSPYPSHSPASLLRRAASGSCTSSLLRALFVPNLKRYEWPPAGERCIHENEKLSRPARPSVRPFVHFSRPGKTLSIVSLFVRGGRASSRRARLPPSSFYSAVRRPPRHCLLVTRRYLYVEVAVR